VTFHHVVQILASVPDVRDVISVDDTSLDLREIVSLVQTEVLRMIRSHRWSWHDDPVGRLEDRFHVVDVGSRDECREGRPSLIGQYVPLGPELAPISGIGAGLRPPRDALTELESSDCHFHLIS
jgi:hypothetical protein